MLRLAEFRVVRCDTCHRTMVVANLDTGTSLPHGGGVAVAIKSLGQFLHCALDRFGRIGGGSDSLDDALDPATSKVSDCFFPTGGPQGLDGIGSQLIVGMPELEMSSVGEPEGLSRSASRRGATAPPGIDLDEAICFQNIEVATDTRRGHVQAVRKVGGSDGRMFQQRMRDLAAGVAVLDLSHRSHLHASLSSSSDINGLVTQSRMYSTTQVFLNSFPLSNLGPIGAYLVVFLGMTKLAQCMRAVVDAYSECLAGPLG